METPLPSTGLSRSAGKRRRRNLLKHAGRLVGKSRSLVRDPQLEDVNQTRIGGSECGDPSVYLAVCPGYWLCDRPDYYPLHKVEVEDSSSLKAPAASRVANLKTDVGDKTFVSVQSRWIVGVGGCPGAAVIFDTKTGEVMPGPKLVAAKFFPVVAAVGYKVFALSGIPNFLTEPDFVPWFEVLDLSKAIDVHGQLSLLDQCSWEALPCPLFFPCKLPTELYRNPPIFSVKSYVVVGHYILLTVYGQDITNRISLKPIKSHKVTYAYDTKSEKWLKVDNTCLPFVGPATPHGQTGRIFLGLSQENGPINAYRISVSSSSSSSTMAPTSDNAGALKLSITVFSVNIDVHEQVGVDTGHYFTSLDREHFCMLSYWVDNHDCFMKYCENNGEYYSGNLFAKLRTYQIESESLALLETLEDVEILPGVMPEIAISKQWEQRFKIFSTNGFATQPIAFILSI